MSKKEKWELLEAIYGPEGLEDIKVQTPKWYAEKEKRIDEDGKNSAYEKGHVLGIVRDFNDKQKIVACTVEGGDDALKYFLELQDKLEQIKEKWNKYKSFLQEKYPTENKKEWEFTCSIHKEIDNILNS